jgi:hypothetical protein
MKALGVFISTYLMVNKENLSDITKDSEVSDNKESQNSNDGQSENLCLFS